MRSWGDEFGDITSYSEPDLVQLSFASQVMNLGTMKRHRDVHVRRSKLPDAFLDKK